MNTKTDRATCNVLNRLIVACHDDIRAQRATANMVSGDREAALVASVTKRTAFAGELAALVRSLGGTASDGGSLFEGARMLLGRARFLMIGNHPGDSYSAAARVERKTADLYERALKSSLPESARPVVERQRTDIEEQYTELHKLRIS